MHVTESPNLIPLDEAAHRLGVSADELRRRLERGKAVRGLQAGGRWFMDQAGRSADPAEALAEPSAVSVVALQTAIEALTEQLARKDHQIEALQTTIARQQVLIDRLLKPPPALDATMLPPSRRARTRLPRWRTVTHWMNSPEGTVLSLLLGAGLLALWLVWLLDLLGMRSW